MARPGSKLLLLITTILILSAADLNCRTENPAKGAILVIEGITNNDLQCTGEYPIKWEVLTGGDYIDYALAVFPKQNTETVECAG